ncbi:MAG: nucleotide sugar dehydrogenase [Thermoguttaceae bacterium]|jgi:UDP-N-acetyl-D-glucosamine dehydrogenase
MNYKLEEAIGNRSAKVGVIGLGYVGLPLIRAFISGGFKTMGFDLDQAKVDKLRSGQSYIKHISSQWIANHVSDGNFEPTADMRRLAEADALLICVPTPLNETRDPDLTYIVSSARQIAKVLRPGQLIVLESTTYPGTTREVILPILTAGGLKAGKDFFLAFSPEREDPGNPKYSAESIPKVVGGIDPESGRLAALLYANAVVKVVSVSSCEIAEAAKIMENTYRSVNIAMVNELKMLFDRMGIDVWEVIEAAKTKPFGFQAFYPGPGLGGHCIPIDPFYLTWLARRHGLVTRFIELAGEINTFMPRYVVNRLQEALNNKSKPLRGSKICVLGVAYKKDVDDPRESPSFELMELLLADGAIVTYNDPHVPVLPKMRRHRRLPAMTSTPLTPEFLAGLDCVLIATDHSAYDYDVIVRYAPLIIDTRNATKNITLFRDKICKA